MGIGWRGEGSRDEVVVVGEGRVLADGPFCKILGLEGGEWCAG